MRCQNCEAKQGERRMLHPPYFGKVRLLTCAAASSKDKDTVQRAVIIRVAGPGSAYGTSKMPPTNPTSSVITEQLTRALGEAVIRIWSNLPQDVQNHLFQEAVTSQGESIRSQLAVFLHDKHSRTADPLGDPRQATEPDSHGG